MCKPLPGLRCSKDAYRDLMKAKSAHKSLKDLIKEKEEKEGDAFARSDAAKRYQDELLKKSIILDKRQRQYDMTVVAKDDITIARHYEPPEPEGTRDPKNPDYDKKAWANYQTKREAHNYLKQRYAEVKKWQTGDPKLSKQENQAFKEKYEAMEAMVQPSRDIGLYLESITKPDTPPRFPARNAEVVAMFDHLKNSPRDEKGRKLTPEEETIYNNAVQLVEAGEEFTPDAKKKREASRFAKARQDTQSGKRAAEVTPLVDWELKTAQEAEAQRKKVARAEALKKQQQKMAMPALPPAPVLGQAKPKTATPATTKSAPPSGLSSSTGKPLIRVEGADRAGDIKSGTATVSVKPPVAVRPTAVSAPPRVATPKMPPMPTAPVRPSLLKRLFGRR